MEPPLEGELGANSDPRITPITLVWRFVGHASKNFECCSTPWSLYEGHLGCERVVFVYTIKITLMTLYHMESSTEVAFLSKDHD